MIFALALSLFTFAAQGVGTWWHWMNGHITREGITKDLESMAAAGIKSATIFNVYRPFDGGFKMKQVAPENVREIDESQMAQVPFGSEEFFAMFRYALDEAARLGIELGAANCDGWSESGGPWISPERSMKELIWCREDLGETLDSKIRCGFCRDIATVETGTRKYRFAFTTNGKTNHPASPQGKGLECDKMDASALDWHFSHYPKQLLAAAGPHAGKTFKYFLVDSWECGFQTWTDRFPEEFKARRGYDPIPYLPVIAGETIGSKEDSEAFLHDFNLTCSDLIIENYFKRFSELCHENGMLLYSEGIYGWDNLPAVDVLKTYKYCDVPMTEFWAKIAAHTHPAKMSYNEPLKHFSPQHAALLYNKPFVAAEAYTGYGIYSESPFDLKCYGDRAFAHGVDNMILHSYVHQPVDKAPGLTLGIYGQAFNRLNPYFNFSKAFWEYHDRIQNELSGGVHVADTLVYIGDVLPAFEMKEDEIQRLLPHGRTFQYINQDVLLSGRVTAKDGLVWLDGDKAFSEIAIRQDALDLATMEQLAVLANAGATITGVKPVRTLRLLNRESETARLREIAGRIFRSPKAFKCRNDIEFASDGDVETVFARHVRKGTKDVYFLASAFDFADRTLEVKFNNLAVQSQHAVLLDPVDGRKYAISSDATGTFALRLHPRQSAIMIFGESTENLPSYKSEIFAPETTASFAFPAADGKIYFESDADIAPIPIGSFHSLTEEADADVKYYCGVLRYEFSLEIPNLRENARVFLKLPAFGATAEATVNGRLAGTIWDPYAPLEITDFILPGSRRQQFTIRTTNPWRNRLVGDLIQNRGAKAAFTTSPGIDKYDMKPYVMKSAPLLPTGISRPIVIETRPQARPGAPREKAAATSAALP